ncbi:MAG TPA: hypothetical protein VEJ84_12135 [Acidimicrobiales bacterium]|nr:hypothetical protein [Acidimicrobiales bacterium]
MTGFRPEGPLPANGSIRAASAGGQTGPETVAFACTMITTLPMLLVFLVAQRTFIRAISGSGVE